MKNLLPPNGWSAKRQKGQNSIETAIKAIANTDIIIDTTTATAEKETESTAITAAETMKTTTAISTREADTLATKPMTRTGRDTSTMATEAGNAIRNAGQRRGGSHRVTGARLMLPCVMHG